MRLNNLFTVLLFWRTIFYKTHTSVDQRYSLTISLFFVLLPSGQTATEKFLIITTRQEDGTSARSTSSTRAPPMADTASLLRSPFSPSGPKRTPSSSSTRRGSCRDPGRTKRRVGELWFQPKFNSTLYCCLIFQSAFGAGSSVSWTVSFLLLEFTDEECGNLLALHWLKHPPLLCESSKGCLELIFWFLSLKRKGEDKASSACWNVFFFPGWGSPASRAILDRTSHQPVCCFLCLLSGCN